MNTKQLTNVHKPPSWQEYFHGAAHTHVLQGFYKGGQAARSDSKAADWNYGHWMFDMAVRDPGWGHRLVQGGSKTATKYMILKL